MEIRTSIVPLPESGSFRLVCGPCPMLISSEKYRQRSFCLPICWKQPVQNCGPFGISRSLEFRVTRSHSNYPGTPGAPAGPSIRRRCGYSWWSNRRCRPSRTGRPRTDPLRPTGAAPPRLRYLDSYHRLLGSSGETDPVGSRYAIKIPTWSPNVGRLCARGGKGSLRSISGRTRTERAVLGQPAQVVGDLHHLGLVPRPSGQGKLDSCLAETKTNSEGESLVPRGQRETQGSYPAFR